MDRLLAKAAKTEKPTTEKQALFNQKLASLCRKKDFLFVNLDGRRIYMNVDGYLHDVMQDQAERFVQAGNLSAARLIDPID